MTQTHETPRAGLNAGGKKLHDSSVADLLTIMSSVSGVANYLKFAPHVEADTYSRMADFSHLLACLDQAYDTAGMQRYRDKASLMARESLMASPFMAALIDPGTITEPFTGSAASLLDLVESRHSNHQGSNWPQSGRGVSRLLKRHSPALRSICWQVDHREDPLNSRLM